MTKARKNKKRVKGARGRGGRCIRQEGTPEIKGDKEEDKRR